ncbi:hypothetical protein D3C76_1307580 [compost metagenome]
MKNITKLQQRLPVVCNDPYQIGLRILDNTISAKLDGLAILAAAFGPDPFYPGCPAEGTAQILLLPQIIHNGCMHFFPDRGRLISAYRFTFFNNIHYRHIHEPGPFSPHYNCINALKL